MPEQIRGPSGDPLGDAFSLVGIEVMKTSTNLQTVTIGRLYLTGVSGNLSNSLAIPNPAGGKSLVYAAGERWIVRWDWDNVKGSHVNVQIGSGQHQLRYAFRATSRQSKDDQGNNIRYFNAIRQQTQATNWNPNTVDGTEARALVEWWSGRFYEARWGIYSGETPYQ